MAKQYKKKIIYEPQEPSVIIKNLPFWWFTDIAIQFKKRAIEKTLIYAVYDNVIKTSLEDPFPYSGPKIKHSIPYNPEEYPEERSFDNFPPEEGSPFYNNLNGLLKSKGCSLDAITLIHAIMRYYSMGRGEVEVISLLYTKRGEKEEFWREINDRSLIHFLDKGGVEYLDKTFRKL